MRRLRILTIALLGLSACGSDDPGGSGASPTRVVELAATEYTFRADARITIEAGDTIEFRVRNEGGIDHQFEVLTGASRRIGVTERIPPGSTDTLTVTFEEAGVYLAICDIDDHRSRGQQAEFDVLDASLDAAPDASLDAAPDAALDEG